MYAAVLVAFLAGMAVMAPSRHPLRKARHAGPSALESIGSALLLLGAKGVYAGIVGSSDPTPQEKTSHQLTSA